MNVDREMYITAWVIYYLEELKEKGFVSGGYDVDMEGIEAIMVIGRKENYKEPNEKEISEILYSLQNSLDSTPNPC